MKSRTLTLSLIASLAIQNATAESNTTGNIELDPIVVNSDFREKKLSQTNNSVTVIGEEEIYDKASQAFIETLASTPNVNFTAGASKAKYIQIRGIGERSQFETPINPSVGLIVDGIDFSHTTLGVGAFDVKQIEVLRGPQGTTFGANGMAGVVTVESNEPTKETQAHLEATLGNYDTKAFGAAVGGAITETLLGRFSIYKNSSDGYMENSFLDRDDTNDIDELTAKAQLRWLLSDRHTIDLNYMHIDVDNGYDAFTFDNSRVSLADEPGKDTQKTDAVALKSTSDFNTFRLISKLSYSQSDMTYSYDEDWANEAYYPGENWKGSDEYIRDKKQTDLDIRLISNDSGRIFNGSSDWTIGAYYKDYREKLLRNHLYVDLYDVGHPVYNTQYEGEYKTQNTALYGQLDTHLNPQWILTTGLRVENIQSDYTDSADSDIPTDETLVGGKIGLSYAPNADKLYYATLSRGYKPGGVNANNEIPYDVREFKTETLWNIDLGMNGNYLDNRLLSRFNLFYGKRKDQQVKSSYVTNASGGGAVFNEYFANAAEGTYYGLEAQAEYAATDALRLYASLGLLKAKFDEYNDPNPDAVDVNGRAPAQSPEYQYNVGVNYFITDAWIAKADIAGRGSYYFSNRHNEKADASTIANASLEYVYHNITASLWIRNITDEETQVRGFGSFGNNPANGWETELYTQLGAPRTFGLTVSYDF